jgi:hypothetical protein
VLGSGGKAMLAHGLDHGLDHGLTQRCHDGNSSSE